MTETTDRLNGTPTAKQHGLLFVDSKEFSDIYQALYHWVFVAGISVSYLIATLYVLPLVTLSVYCFIHLGIALAWIGVGWFMKRFIVQDKLIKHADLIGGKHV